MSKCINPYCERPAVYLSSDCDEGLRGPFFARCGGCGTCGPRVSVDEIVADRLEPGDYKGAIPSECDYDDAAASALELWNDIAAAARAGVKAQRGVPA